MPQIYPAAQAREDAGLSLEAAARFARVSRKYLQACERTGQFSYGLALKLSRRYGARIEDFLPTQRPRTVERSSTGNPRTGVVRKQLQSARH
jgi:hypothetical protein